MLQFSIIVNWTKTSCKLLKAEKILKIHTAYVKITCTQLRVKLKVYNDKKVVVNT